MSVQNKPLAVDLFAGAGGLSLGLEEAGFDVAAAVEFDPVHAAVHEYNFPEAATLCADVRKINGQYIRDNSRIGQREIALVAGGPPCQGISTMGKRMIDDPRNELLKEYVRLVVELQPRYFLMENVSGLTVGAYKTLLMEVIELLNEAKYSVTPYRVLQAADYGTPQSRRRLILLGAREGIEPPEYPEATFTPRRIKGTIPKIRKNLPLGPSVMDALGDLPNADDYPELLHGDEVAPVEYGEPSEYAKGLQNTAFDPLNYAAMRQFDSTALTSSPRTVHTEKSIARFADTVPGTSEPVSRFVRLHPDGLANTLRAGTASDHGAFTAPRPIHPVYPRVITPREAARLHGYPDWFRFHVTKWNGFREIGNSVPIPLGRAVGSAIMKAGGWQPEHDTRILKRRDSVLLTFSQNEAQRYYCIDEQVIPKRATRGKK